MWHNSRRDMAGRTREYLSASQPRKAEMDRSANSHTGPQHMALLIEGGQMTASDYVPRRSSGRIIATVATRATPTWVRAAVN